VHGDYVGGGFYCLNLARGLGSDQPFYALSPFGVQGEPTPRTIEAMAEAYVEMVRGVQPAGPYVLGGYCNGGVVAFEMARQLQGNGEKVDLVVMVGSVLRNSGFRLPLSILRAVVNCFGDWRRWDPDARTEVFLLLRDEIVHILRRYRQYVQRLKEVAQLRFGHQIVWALRLAKRVVWNMAWRLAPSGKQRASGSPREPRPIDRFELTEMDKFYFKLQDNYIPWYYPGRIVLLWPGETNLNLPEEPVLIWDNLPDPTLGWRKVVGEVEVYKVPGNHPGSITKHVQILAEQMKACLDKSQRNKSSNT
jgi:thioesterase domain-containing protein